MSDGRLELSLEVRGSNGIDFKEGWQTGDMACGGIGIDTVWYADDRVKAGGCIDRDQARQLHRFLSSCIKKWDAEELATPE